MDPRPTYVTDAYTPKAREPYKSVEVSLGPRGPEFQGSQVGPLARIRVALCWGVYSMLRNNASGPEIGLPGWIFAALPPGKAGRRADFGAFPEAVRPKSSPEDRVPARKQYCVT